MIVIKVYLHPNGDPRNARLLALGNIINDGTGDRHYGNYTTEFISYGNGKLGVPDETFKGEVKNFPRQMGALDLLADALFTMDEVDEGKEDGD